MGVDAGSRDNPIIAVGVRFLDVEHATDLDDGAPRVIFHLEKERDGAMVSCAMTVADARELGERLLAAVGEVDGE